MTLVAKKAAAAKRSFKRLKDVSYKVRCLLRFWGVPSANTESQLETDVEMKRVG